MKKMEVTEAEQNLIEGYRYLPIIIQEAIHSIIAGQLIHKRLQIPRELCEAYGLASEDMLRIVDKIKGKVSPEGEA